MRRGNVTNACYDRTQMARLQMTLPDLVSLRTTDPVSREEFRDVVAANPDLRIERTAEGELIIMAPAHSETGDQNAELTMQLRQWAKKNGQGKAYDSSAGFDLPNGANRSPDASWILKSRLKALSKEERKDFFPICPDFVVELRSKTDRLSALQDKMREYLDNGARLGWLIDPVRRRVYVYRRDQSVECLEEPGVVSGDPELPGFTLDLDPIWNPEI